MAHENLFFISCCAFHFISVFFTLYLPWSLFPRRLQPKRRMLIMAISCKSVRLSLPSSHEGKGRIKRKQKLLVDDQKWWRHWGEVDKLVYFRLFIWVCAFSCPCLWFLMRDLWIASANLVYDWRYMTTKRTWPRRTLPKKDLTRREDNQRRYSTCSKSRQHFVPWLLQVASHIYTFC